MYTVDSKQVAGNPVQQEDGLVVVHKQAEIVNTVAVVLAFVAGKLSIVQRPVAAVVFAVPQKQELQGSRKQRAQLHAEPLQVYLYWNLL